MIAVTDNLLHVSLETEHDGNYWIVRSPELGLVAAHQKVSNAWLRAARMVVGQISYALNTDPSLSGLFPDKEASAKVLEQVHKLKEQGQFDLKITTEYSPELTLEDPSPRRKPLTFEVPELMCM